MVQTCFFMLNNIILVFLILIILEIEADDGDSGHGDSSVSSDIKDEELPSHLLISKDFTFRVTLLQAFGVPNEYADIFCQFK